MNKSTSKDIESLRKKNEELYKGGDNFGIVYVADRWICGLMLEGIRYVGEGNTPYDAYEAFTIDIAERYARVQKIIELGKKYSGEE